MTASLFLLPAHMNNLVSTPPSPRPSPFPSLTFSRETRLKTIKLCPTLHQEEVLQGWFRAAEITFNNTLFYITKQESQGRPVPPLDVLKRMMVNYPDPAWIKDVPSLLRQQAVAQAYYYGGDSCGWPATIVLPTMAWSLRAPHVPFPTFFGRDPIQTVGEPMPQHFRTDAFVRRTTDGFFICFEDRGEEDDQSKNYFEYKPLRRAMQYDGTDRVIALDPGVRTPITGYSQQRFIVQCHGTDDASLDQLLKWLERTYKVVVYPEYLDLEFMTQYIHNAEERAQLVRFHREFIRRLEQETTCQVVYISEAYTTKTCSNCRYLHAEFSADKVYECPSCGYEADRDVNAAKNMLRQYEYM